MRERIPCVYIMSNRLRGTLYAGVTSDLVQRIWQHKQHLVDGFTKKYEIDLLVWYQVHAKMESAITTRKRSRRGSGFGR